MSYFIELFKSFLHEPGSNPSERLPDGTNAVTPLDWKKIEKELEERNKENKKLNKPDNQINGPY